MAMDFGSKEVEPMLDEGAIHGQPTYSYGTVKSPDLKFVHVFCLHVIS